MWKVKFLLDWAHHSTTGVRSQAEGRFTQPAASAAHEADGVDEDGFAYSILPAPMASPGEEWCLKGAKEAVSEGSDGTVAILDTGRATAMCSRYAFHRMKH